MSLHVTVENFQSLAKVEVTLDGLTVLVGPSNRGKSALIRALDGAFFNRPGAYFVREGAKAARVTVLWGDEHKARPAHALVWEKGDGVNKYTLDGVTFDKVGKTTPPELQQLGFREETIGSRLNAEGTPEGGTALRPQIAGQLDEIFLLKQSGTFIGEVVTKLSRLAVLQRATRECALDKASTARLLKLRQVDYAEATRLAEQLAPVPLLRARLNGLITLDEEIEDRKDRKVRIKHYVELRQQALARLALALPPPTVAPEAAAKMLQEYRQLLSVRAQLARRATLATLPKKVTKFAASDGPAYLALQAAAAKRDQLAQLIGARVMRGTVVDAATHAVAQSETRYRNAVAALDQFKRDTPICPLCTQPWAQPPDPYRITPTSQEYLDAGVERL